MTTLISVPSSRYQNAGKLPRVAVIESGVIARMTEVVIPKASSPAPNRRTSEKSSPSGRLTMTPSSQTRGRADRLASRFTPAS